MSSTFVIGGKRYRIRSRTRFVMSITIMLVALIFICGFAFGGGVSGSEKMIYKSVTVESGDTLWSIATKNKPEDQNIRQFVAAIRACNDVDPGSLQVGQTIYVPMT